MGVEEGILISDSVKFNNKGGRFIIVKGKLENEIVTLVNVYAPPNSGKHLIKTLYNYNYYKLYTSIISKRFEQFMSDIIDEDQTGFIKGRQTHDNITLHIIEHVKHNNTSAASSLDVEKAFDCVNLAYLYQTLKKFGLNKKAVQCIKTLYQKPTARIKINGSLSESIQLERSTRQGC